MYKINALDTLMFFHIIKGSCLHLVYVPALLIQIKSKRLPLLNHKFTIFIPKIYPITMLAEYCMYVLCDCFFCKFIKLTNLVLL